MDSVARHFYDTDDPMRWGRDEMTAEKEVTSGWLQCHGLDGPIVELGCGRAGLASIHPRYHGIDLSFVALANAVHEKGRICADMEVLPLASRSVQFLFSWAAIEHVPSPDNVLREIERVLRPGGIALLAPAWHCRPWAAEGLEFRPYSKLSPGQRLRKLLIPIRNSLILRAPPALARRLLREIAALKRTPLDFSYHRLNPNLDEYVGTDCDAFTSMDPHEMALYFATRGWRVLSHDRPRSRLLARHEPVVVEKPGE